MFNMFKSRSTAAIIIATTVILTGCGSGGSSKKKSSTLQGNTAGFPGGTVEANYLADDGKAFSNAGQQVLLPLTLYWNKSTGQAIGIMATGPYVSGQNPAILYAAWFDGTAWHTPVEIHGLNEDPDSGIGGFMVLWLNTTGNTNANALARNGDAMIFFTRDDVDPPVAGDADGNTRFYASYFDASVANAAASGTIQGGFDTLATPIDLDNVIIAGNTFFNGSATDNDPDVGAVAIASDSLVGSHAMGGGVVVDSGDPTTFVHLLYRKDSSTSATNDPTTLAEIVGNRWWSVQFDLTQVGNTFPVATVANRLALATGLDDPTDIEDVATAVTVHNGHVFTTVGGVVQAPGGNDTALMAYAFNTTATPAVFELNSTRPTGSADTATLPSLAHVYGADHGLASTLFFFEETGFQDLAANGSRSANRDIMLGELQVAGGVTTEGAGSPMDVDGSQGTIDTTNGDGDGITIRIGGASTSAGTVDQGSLRTRINRSGTAIVALFLQQNSDVTDLDDTTGTVGTHTTNLVPYVTAVQTRLDATDTRALSASVAAVGTALAVKLPSFGSTSNSGTSAGQIQDNVLLATLKFQEGLAGGAAASQVNGSGALNGVPCDRGATFQGNHLRMNFIYGQGSDRTVGGDIDNFVLFVNGVTITLGATPVTPPTMSITNATIAAATVEEVDDFYDARFALEAGQAVAVDAGDNTATAAGGRVLVFFPSNENNVLENVAGSFDEQRLFVSEQTAAGTAGPRTLVSSDPATTFQPHSDQERSFQGLMLAPVNANTVTTPNHVGDRIHLYWVEERGAAGSGLPPAGAPRRLATRSYSQAGITATTPVALGNRFVPALPTTPGTGAPTFIDLQSSGDLLDGFFVGLPAGNFGRLVGGRNGSTVGVFFDEDAHLYYAETASDGASYPTSFGVVDPALVDNDSSFAYDLDDFTVWFQPIGNNLSRCQATFQRFDSVNVGGPGIARMFVRSHN